MRCAEHIGREVAAAGLSIADKTIRVTACVGAAALERDVKDEQELLRRADEALMRAKREGRDRICLWQGAEQKAGDRRNAENQ